MTNHAVYNRALHHIKRANEDIFVKLVDEFNVKTGDWAPEQQVALSCAEEQVAHLMVAWYMQNK